jgi:hypothetical protein
MKSVARVWRGDVMVHDVGDEEGAVRGQEEQARYVSVCIFISAEQDGVHKEALPESQKEGVWLGDVMSRDESGEMTSCQKERSKDND